MAAVQEMLAELEVSDDEVSDDGCAAHAEGVQTNVVPEAGTDVFLCLHFDVLAVPEVVLFNHAAVLDILLLL